MPNVYLTPTASSASLNSDAAVRAMNCTLDGRFEDAS
jgi:hypothetical protein